MSKAKRFNYGPAITVRVPQRFNETVKHITRSLDEDPELEQVIVDFLNMLLQRANKV